MHKYIYENKSVEEVRNYNINWHKNIAYNADDFIFKLYMQKKIFDECKKIFDYESNGTTETQLYYPLNLKKNENHKLIFQELTNIINQYKLDIENKKHLDLSGKIFKYFLSCEDYHCKEILNSIKNFEDAQYNLKDAPIMLIVRALKEAMETNIEYLIFNAKIEFDLVEHISINWNQTRNHVPDDNDDINIFFRDSQNEEKARQILSKFQNKWKVVCRRKDNDFYSVKFKSFEEFNKFRTCVVEVSKSPDSMGAIKGDVLKLVEKYNHVKGIVEIDMVTIFDILFPLAHLLNMKSGYTDNAFASF